MHDNKSQRPVVYCGKLLRLWPKMIRPQGKISQCLLSQTLKNTAWQSINSLLRKREFTFSWRAPAWFSAITIWKGRRWVLQRWCVGGGGEIDQRAERKAEGGSAEREERLTCWTWRMDELHSSRARYYTAGERIRARAGNRERKAHQTPRLHFYSIYSYPTVMRNKMPIKSSAS